jgi:hypothetical protein
MSDDMDGMDMAFLARFKPRQAHTATGRRVAETRPVHHLDGRKSRATGRTAQLNLKVRHEFRDHVAALAQQERLMMVEIIEKAVMEYAERRGR